MATRIDSNAMALLALRCPRCHQGKLFTHSALNLTKFAEMPAQCPVCGQSFEPEPGFYFGSMFITYGFNVAMVLGLGVLIYYVFGNPDTWVYVSVVTVAALVLAPLVLRYSRAMMLYWFGGVHYDPKWQNQGRVMPS
ncbi:DUF983 domain-containing protein [Hymenobacter sp. BT770]|uniref:DUF983 domain-containing protein n=1 Tax=Hymenobacter sp. BT770 TaxID=2886942 RepID=UPI001D0FA077|nr:DUF983 domain-containing protein [Hymenobacter sp. BT770]MCC3152743.1 DUF983 domain-containing protein [Hymenobacter sp. BT770]MDO3414816.1 DUF983 domain-containing protein [Hymenobacter sp. BT770]